VSFAEAWSDQLSCLTAFVREWQKLEHCLSIRACSLGVTLSEACLSDLPEAAQMRRLESKIAATERALARRLKQIQAMPATSIDGALAKVELALKMQEPSDWRQDSWRLAQEGLVELKSFVRNSA
jgi:hypothetical protein